jgi:isopentenyl diphosphate isomerase/L-lactate dehydrogenase-like FMN-dependent dehydrogenase
VQHGADGIIVSNHGGRQLDDAPAALDVLAGVVQAVPGVPVLLDGGVRRGSDIVKALALGAHACLIGRPWLYGLAADGERGVAAVLETLRVELDRTLALIGRRSVHDLDSGLVGGAMPPGPAPGISRG